MGYQRKLYSKSSCNNAFPLSGSETVFRFYDCNGENPSVIPHNGCDELPRPFITKSLKVGFDETGNYVDDGYTEDRRIDKYKDLNLPAQSTQLGWLPTYYTYSPAENIESVSYNGHTKSYQYALGAQNLLTRITEVDSTEKTFHYDKLSRLEKEVDECTNIETKFDYRFNYHGENVNLVETTLDVTTASSASSISTMISRTYLDGLGREIVSVEKHGGPDSNQDIVAGQTYIEFGEMEKVYEPFTTTNTYGVYQSINPALDHSLSEYEASPLGRPTATTLASWYTVETAYS